MPKNEQLRIGRLLIISRPFWWVNTAVPFLAGALLATHALTVPTVIGFLYFLIPYNLLMYGVNDIYDYESDIKNPRKNGSINGSVLARSLHARLWVVMLALNVPFWIYFASIGNAWADIFFALMMFMVFAYSVAWLRFKELPVVDSLTSAFHYSSPFLYGLLLFESEALWLPVFFSFYLWVVANHAFGAIQDIVPDRQAGIGSVATKLGSKKTLYFTILCYSTAALLPLIFYGVPGIFGSLAVLPYLFIVLRCLPHRNKDSSKIFARSWNYFLYCNYIIGFLGSLLLLYLYNR